MYNETAYGLGANSCIIRDIAEYGARRAAEIGDENVFNFTIGNPSLPTPPEVTQALVDILHDTDNLAIHSYTPAIGDAACRAAIAADLNSRYGADVSAEDLFIGCGASPELAAVFQAVSFPGAEIVALAPYFPEYRPFVEAAGAKFVVVPPDLPDFQICTAAVEAALTPNTAAVIVNSPNNPAGTVYTEQSLMALSDLLRRKAKEYGHPIYLVSDDPYRELTYGGVEAVFLPKLYDDTIVCYSYSKSLTLPGERIGYIYVPKACADSRALYVAICGAARAIGHICAPSLWQKVIARCAHLRPDLTDYDRNRRALYEGLTKAGYEVAKPDGAFYMFVKAPGGSSVAFAEKAKKYDLFIVPGDDFGCPEYFRLCYCGCLEKIQKSLPIFEKLMEE